jgi:hypothetical protein
MTIPRRAFFLLIAAGRPQAAFGQQRGVPPPAQPDIEATAKALRDALTALAQFEITRRAAQLAEDGAKALSGVVADGVTTLTKRGELLNTFAASVAIDGARRLGIEIVTEAIRLNGNLKSIGAQAVMATQKRLCPMYPFC